MNAIVKAAPPTTESQIVDHSGAALYRVSTDAAAICRDIVLATASNIQGRKYVQVEGWQAIALAHGCAASSGNVTRFDDGSISATGRVIRIDTGTLIASAEGYVGADEPTWFGGSVTDRWGKTKVLPKRSDYAIRAMAQTRAISRACRSAFAHVVVMMNVGLSTTPAEEVPEEGFDPAPRNPPDQPRVSDPAPAASYTPPAEPRRTIRDWLNDLRLQLAAAHTLAAVDAIATSDEVMAALRSLRNGAREELNALLAEAIERTTRPAGEAPAEDVSDDDEAIDWDKPSTEVHGPVENV